MRETPARSSFWRRLWRLLLWLTLLAVLCAGAVVGGVAYVLSPELQRHEAAVEALRSRQSFGHGWQFHSRMYTAPFELQPGMVLSMRRLQEQLELRDYKRLANPPAQTKKRDPAASSPAPGRGRAGGDAVPPWVPFGGIGGPAVPSSPAGTAESDTLTAPLEPGEFRIFATTIEIHLRGFTLPGEQGEAGPVRVSFLRGKVVDILPLETGPRTRYALEPIQLAELLGSPPRRCTFVPLKEIPPHVQNAVIASEDARFWSHPGIDPVGLLRAVLTNLQAGELVQGGSTLTQQVARTLFLSTARTYQRKLSEVAIALLLDRRISKPELLELYLNSVYVGQLEGVAIHGVEEAARMIFNRSVRDLTVAQAATLAGVIPAPNAYSPLRNPDRALERRNIVLGLMRDQGLLPATVVQDAQAEALEVATAPPVPVRYGYYSGYVRDFLKKALDEGYELQGLTVYAAVDLALQTTAEASLLREIEARQRSWGRTLEPLQGAVFLMDHQTGRVLAVAGGRGYEANPFNRAYQARRQPGSAFKPLVFAAALEGGEGHSPYTPASTVPDLRRAFTVKEGQWRPRNYEGEYHDTVTLAKALVKSLNVATVNLTDQVGPERVAMLASRLGMDGLKPVLSIGLGTNVVTLEQLTSAFATFPGHGLRIKPQPVSRVVDLWGRTRWAPPAPSEVILKDSTAAVMVEMLRNVVIYGTSWTLRTEGYYTRPSAGKTGTSQGENDAWYVGFTPEWILGAWVGFDTPSHLLGSAADVAVPFWGGVMTDLTSDRPVLDFELPEGLEYTWIDPYSGGRAGALCPSNMRVAFLAGTAPTFGCPLGHEEPLEQEGEGAQDDSDEGVAPGAAGGTRATDAPAPEAAPAPAP